VPTRRPGKRHARLALLVWLCLCGIWGSTWLAIKLGLRDLPPLTLAGFRFAIAALMLFAIVLMRGQRLPRSAREWRLLAYTALLTPWLCSSGCCSRARQSGGTAAGGAAIITGLALAVLRR
jgi:drug/metabolite transporter (DMT)-like permease